MPRIALSSLPDEARIWIFGISPALDEPKQRTLLAEVDRFLETWAAHGQPITSARELREGMFLIVGVDRASETSGCSIDRMFGTLQKLERELGVSILDSGRIFVRHGDGRPDALSRPAFRERADPHTTVFDTLVESLGDVRAGRWETTAADSWHRELLRTTV